jgi:hypothetical protein
MSLIDMVDDLQAAARREGLIELLGQDEIQRVLSEVFASDEPLSGSAENE